MSDNEPTSLIQAKTGKQVNDKYKSPGELVKAWGRDVLKRKLAIDKQIPINVTDMQKLADLAMYDGIVELHEILKLENVTEREVSDGEGGTRTVFMSNVPHKIQAANGITAAQRYLLERARADNEEDERGTTIVFEESQQITNSDGTKVLTVKKTTGRKPSADYSEDVAQDRDPEGVEFDMGDI